MQFLTHSRCGIDDYCLDGNGSAYYLTTFHGEGETWLGFKDDSLCLSKDNTPVHQQWYRMVKIEGGARCSRCGT